MSTGPSDSHSTILEPGVSWWLDPALAKLAFGSRPRRASGTGATGVPSHLAFLPPENLEIDLSDPQQRTFGDYELLELIGQGGMGLVYRARQHSLDRDVAVKLLSAGPWASVDFIARFQREAQSAARMQHPNIVPIHEIGAHEELNFFSMRLVNGGSLANLLAKRGPMPPREAARILRAVAEAVDYAHRLDVLHLDLKPGNVLLDDESGEPLVADFGLAKRLDESLAADSSEVSGTPSYMAPEQAQVDAQSLTPATDIYGLGAILYECLTGRPPFAAASAQETLRLVVSESAPSLRSIDPAIPDDLEAICLKCLSKEPADRYRSARVLADDLGRFLDYRSVQARPLNRRQRIARWGQREPRLAVASAIAVAALVTGLVATAHQWSRAESNAAVASQRLWEGRRETALQLEADGRGWDAVDRLLHNIAEQRADGREAGADADRLRLGLLLGQGAMLIDSTLVADAMPLAVAVSDDGGRVALALGDRSVRWYDSATLKEQGRIDLGERPSSGGELRATVLLRFAGADHLLATQEWYRTMPNPSGGDTWLLDLRAGRVVEPPAQFAGFSDATFSDDARVALLRDAEGAVQAWQVSPWAPLSARRPAPGVGEAVPWTLGSNGSHALALSDGQRRLHVFALPALAPLREIEAPHGARITAWRGSRDGSRLAFGDEEGRLYVFDLPDGALRALPSARGREVTWVEFSDDGGWLVAGAEDGRVHAFDAGSGDPLVSGSMEHDFPIRQVGVDRARRLLIVAGDGARALWRLPAARGPSALAPVRIALPPAPHAQAGAHALGWNDQGLLASAGHDGALRLWRLPAGALLPATLARQVAEQPGFAAGRVVDVEWNQVRVLDSRGAAGPWLELPQPPGFAELSVDGRTLLATVGASLQRFDAHSLQPRGAPTPLPQTPQRLVLSPAGDRVLLSFPTRTAGGFGERLQAWDIETGRALPGDVTLRGPLLQLGYLDDGRRVLAVGPPDGATTVLAGAGLRLDGEWPHDSFEPVVAAAPIPGDAALWLLTRANDPRLGRDALLRWRPGDGDASLRRELPNRPFGVAAVAGGGAFVAGETAHALVDANGGLRIVPRVIDPGDATMGSVAVRGDGRVVAVAGRYGVQLFAADGTPLGRTLHIGSAQHDGIFDLAFFDDGRTLFARTVLGAARWPVSLRARDDAMVAERLSWLTADQRLPRVLPMTTAAQRAALRADDPGGWITPTPRPLPSVAGKGLADGSPIPARSANTPTAALDLTTLYGMGPDAVRSSGGAMKPFLRPWPAGWQQFGGVDFDIRGMADVGPDGLAHCVPVPGGGIAAVHPLLLPTLRSPENNPRTLAELTLHYVDGGLATVPLRATIELRGYGDNDQAVPYAFAARAPRSALGFRVSTAAAPRLANPEPSRAVRCVDLRSTGAPLLLFALTVEPAPVAVPVIAARGSRIP